MVGCRTCIRLFLHHRDERCVNHGLSCKFSEPTSHQGRTLEETAALFDGEEQPAIITNMGGEAATITMNRGVLLQECSQRGNSDESSGIHSHGRVSMEIIDQIDKSM